MMSGTEIVLLVAVIAMIALVAALAWWQIGTLRARLAKTETAFAELAADLEAAPSELKQTLGDATRPLITIEILNPMQVASGESKLAKTFGAVAPKVVRAEVTKRAAQELTEQLAANGVEAEVRVHDGH